MKNLLIIAFISLLAAGCSKDDDGNMPVTIANSQWKSLENVLFMDIYYRKHAGFIAEFDENNFHISYFDKKLREDDIYFNVINKGTYSYKGAKLTLTTEKGQRIQYKVYANKMELIGDALDFFPEDFFPEYQTKYPSILYLSLDGNKDSGDVIEGKTWKLNFIALNGSDKQFNFWENNENYKKSMDMLTQSKNYVITFTGKGWSNGINNGTFTGSAIKSSINGTWMANEYTENIKLDLENELENESDILAKIFLKGLHTTTSFEGDGNVLKLFFKYDTRPMYMHFSLNE